MLPLRAAGGTDSWSELIALRYTPDQDAVPVGHVTPIHATLLMDGTVLMSGYALVGEAEFGLIKGRFRGFLSFIMSPQASVDSQTEFDVTPLQEDVKQPREASFCAGHAYLADGRLLVAGGHRLEPPEGLEYAQIFQLTPGGPVWRRVEADMQGGVRWYPSVTRLPDSSMLVTTGLLDHATNPVNLSVEVFNPAAQGRDSPWTLLSDASTTPRGLGPHDYTHVFVLPEPLLVNGLSRELLMIGADGSTFLCNYTEPLDDAALRYVERKHRPGPQGTGDGSAKWASSVLLPLRFPAPAGEYSNGSILVMGGEEAALAQRADLYDPATDQWRSVNTGIGRSYPSTVLLPDGTVLIVNGGSRTGPGDFRAAQRFDPRTGTVTNGTSVSDDIPRWYHSVALLLPDGRVLVGGGTPIVGYKGDSRADLRYYSPAYLAVLPPNKRPAITGVPTSPMQYGQPYAISYANGPVHRVALVGLGSMTHSIDMNQRFVQLFEGESRGGSLTIRGPANASIAPPGPYLLFVLRKVRGQEVPSVAKIIRLHEQLVPIPDLRVNGSDGPIELAPGERPQLTLAIDPGIAEGHIADWWVSAWTPDGLKWYVRDQGWIRSDQPLLAYEGALAALASDPLPEFSSLPAGSYRFTVAVDIQGDSQVGATYLDSVFVTVR